MCLRPPRFRRWGLWGDDWPAYGQEPFDLALSN